MPDSNNSNRDAIPTSWWKQFLDFMYGGGFRSLIVLVVASGAVFITVRNNSVCEGVPASLPPETGEGSSQNITLVQPNPICSKYFELAFMVIGGYLGISRPSSDSLPNGGSRDSDPVPPPNPDPDPDPDPVPAPEATQADTQDDTMPV